MKSSKDRRVSRTRMALIAAFNDLVLSRGKGEIRVLDIVERANVGRSTFYEHYASADQLHLQALSSPLSVLADAVAGRCEPPKLEKLLGHFWENRQRARSTFTGRQRDQIVRLLADLLEERLADCAGTAAVPLRLAVLQLAEAAMTPIRGWLMAEASCVPENLARAICDTSAAMREALFPRP